MPTNWNERQAQLLTHPSNEPRCYSRRSELRRLERGCKYGVFWRGFGLSPWTNTIAISPSPDLSNFNSGRDGRSGRGISLVQ